MTEPEVEPEFEIDLDREYPWAADGDELRRTFVFEIMGTPEIDGDILVKNMDAVAQWLKTGVVPGAKSPPRLKSVPKGDA